MKKYASGRATRIKRKGFIPVKGSSSVGVGSGSFMGVGFTGVGFGVSIGVSSTDTAVGFGGAERATSAFFSGLGVTNSLSA